MKFRITNYKIAYGLFRILKIFPFRTKIFAQMEAREVWRGKDMDIREDDYYLIILQ